MLLAHQDGLVGRRLGPPGQGWWACVMAPRTGWWANVVACQGRGWQAGFGDPPGLAGGPALWPTRTGAGGPAYGAPGQGLVVSVLMHQYRLVASVGLVPGLCWNRGMELAVRLTGLVLGSSLAMSEACVWACQGDVVSTCSYVRYFGVV